MSTGGDGGKTERKLPELTPEQLSQWEREHALTIDFGFGGPPLSPSQEEQLRERGFVLVPPGVVVFGLLPEKEEGV